MKETPDSLNNLYKARNTLKKLAQANFSRGAKFVTLTFTDQSDFDIKSIPDCNKKYQAFIRRLSRQMGVFKYITVIEYQKRGAVHYHILCNLPYIKKVELGNIWSHGFVQINRVSDDGHIVRYISKYMMKNADDPRFSNLRRYHCSTKLDRPVKLSYRLAHHYWEQVLREKLKPTQWTHYDTRVGTPFLNT